MTAGRVGDTLAASAMCPEAKESREAKRVPEILAALGKGKDVAVVSDAGNPGISDPAERLVRAAVEATLYMISGLG